MPSYLIKHAFNLASAGSKLMHIGQIFTTDDESQVAELNEFAKDGSCQPVAKVEAPQEEVEREVVVNPDQDLAKLPGVGNSSYQKLTEAGINTVDELKAAFADPSRQEAFRTLLGPAYEKIAANFKDSAKTE